MGAVIGVIKDIIGFATQAKAEADREANRGRQKAAAGLKNPIPPPFFYLSLFARTNAESKGELDGPGAPYTIDAIKAALAKGVLPAGYSIEQLADAGFGPQTIAFQTLLNTADAQTRKDLGALINTLADTLEPELADLADLGVTKDDIAHLRQVASEAKKADPAKPDEMIDIGELRAVIDRIKTLSDSASNAEANKEQRSKLVAQEAQAAQDRTAAIVGLAKAAYAPLAK